MGTAGHTEELMCPSNTFNGAKGKTVTCSVSTNSTVEIGNYTCVTWRLDGNDELQIAEFTTSIDNVTQTTIAPADGYLDYEGGTGNNGQTATWCTTGETVQFNRFFPKIMTSISPFFTKRWIVRHRRTPRPIHNINNFCSVYYSSVTNAQVQPIYRLSAYQVFGKY